MLAHARLAQFRLTEVAQLIRAWQNPGDPAPGSSALEPWQKPAGRTTRTGLPRGTFGYLPFEEVAERSGWSLTAYR